MDRKLILIALGLSLYAATVSTCLLLDGMIESNNERIKTMCKKQNLMSEFDCLKQY